MKEFADVPREFIKEGTQVCPRSTFRQPTSGELRLYSRVPFGRCGMDGIYGGIRAG
jgi:hypothetical protein